MLRHVEINCLSVCKRLMKNFDLCCSNNDHLQFASVSQFGENLLMTAVRCRNYKIAKMLIKRKIDCGHKALKFVRSHLIYIQKASHPRITMIHYQICWISLQDIVSLSDSKSLKVINCYFVSCPQMAYDYGMYDLVDLIEDRLKAVNVTSYN